MTSVLHEEEAWVAIPGYENYEVSNFGQVRRGDRVLKQQIRRGGYAAVTLFRAAKRKDRYVHQLVCEAFHGPRPPGYQTRHLDDDKSNNTPENLRWGTAKENRADRIRNGLDHDLNKTQCPYGHEYTEANTYRDRKGHRSCQTCRDERNRRRYR